MILEKIVDLLINKFDIDRIILFGSRATNIFREDSDYDICIVCNDEKDTEIILKCVINFMYENAVNIHPYIFSKAEYEYRSNLEIYQKKIIQEGKILYNQ